MLSAALITARKGPKDKNMWKIKDSNGSRPIVSYPIQAALDAKKIDAVYVTTDSPRVKKVARALGAKTISRPANLATDEAGHGEAIIHGIEQLPKKFDNVVIMIGNTVMNTPGVIDEALDYLEKWKHLDSVMTVMPLEEIHPSRMQELDDNGDLVQLLDSEGPVSTNRQDYKQAFVFDGRIWAIRKGGEQNIGLLKPWTWTGQRCWPIIGINPPVRDVHNNLEVAISEWWLEVGHCL